jgi:hypothetical protein
MHQRKADFGCVQAARQNNDADSVEAALNSLKFYSGIRRENYIRSNFAKISGSTQ